MTSYVWLETVFGADLEQSHVRTRDNQRYENRSITGDYKMKSGQVYLEVAASCVWIRAQSPWIVFNGWTGNRTSVWHQLDAVSTGLGHVTEGNPSNSRIVDAIMWLGKRIAFFAISLSQIHVHVADPLTSLLHSLLSCVRSRMPSVRKNHVGTSVSLYNTAWRRLFVFASYSI